ncbi:MAG: Coenzyme F420 hydrogenase/dehydrogenase, beta subunit C-terminal domain, partial [Candidatus Hodarchaeota archaeon]
ENFPYPQFKDAIQEKSDVSIDTISKMDIDKGKLTLSIEDGTILQYPIKEFNYLVPEACKFCTNFTAELADISVGSVGAKKNWNTLIIRSEKGLEVVERAEDDGIIETTARVSFDTIRKNIVRKRLSSEKIVLKRREKDFYIPNFD